MKKGTIIVDFDQTCVDSSKPVVEMYQKETGDYSKSYDLYKDELDWNFNPIINHNLWNKQKITEAFTKQEFYDNLDMLPNCKESLQKLIDDNWEVIICTKVSGYGIDNKLEYINNYIPHTKVIFLISDDFDKGCIKGDIIIDDNLECLCSGERKFRLCFGNYKWNSNEELKDYKYKDKLIRMNNWEEVYKFINSLK